MMQPTVTKMCVWVGWGLESRPVMDAWECGYDVTNCGRD